jgi:4-hydroxy-2-oxoglutarate aldolase
MTSQLGGILGPVVTPFDARTGDVALDGFVSNLQTHLAAGMSGVVVTGSTGEAALLEESERFLLIETARPLVAPDRWLIAGIGGESTRVTVQRARDAAAAGADAVLVVSPHYYTRLMTSDALRGHFLRVADASPVPVLLYNIPVYAHFALQPDLVAELATHPNIAGMKDSAGELEMLRQYVAVQSPQFTVLTGNGPTFAAAMALGVKGGILAFSLFAYELAREIFDASLSGGVDQAQRVQERVSTAAREIVAVMGVPGVKAALDAIGMRGGPPRSPLLPLDAAGRARVLELVRGVAEVPVA